MDPTILKAQLATNLELVKNRLAGAVERSGRNMDEITLLPVTKKQTCQVITALHDLGYDQVGENRVQDLKEKRDQLGADPPQWHFIGPLQRNKVRKCLAAATWIHSVESEKLLRHMDRIAAEEGVRPNILLELNLSGEKQKHGCDPRGFGYLLDTAREMTNLELAGMMTIGPNTGNMQQVREAFARLRTMMLEYCPDLPHLSMGMSKDLEIAVEEGATFVRVGSALFTDLPEEDED